MLDEAYKLKFMQTFSECLKNGWDTCAARDYSEMCITGKLFHNHANNNTIGHQNQECRGVNGVPEEFSP